MKQVFIALVAPVLLSSGVAMAAGHTPKPSPTPRRVHGVNYNSSKSNTGNITVHGHVATPKPRHTPKPSPTPRRVHSINYNASKSNTGNVTVHGHPATPKPKPTRSP